MIIIQLLLLALLLPLVYGPIGHYNLLMGGPNLLIIALWLFAWLTNRRTALVWAVMAGLAADLLSFDRFGINLFVYLATVVVIDYCRTRFFQVSSAFEAVLTLVVISVLTNLIGSILAGQLSLTHLLVSVFANVVIGTIAYYVLAIRFRLFQRWSGQRL